MDWGNIGLFIIFGAVMFFMHRNGGGCCGSESVGQAPNNHRDHQEAQTINTQQAILAIAGMSCGHCAAKVEKALFSAEGVVSAAVSLESNSVKIAYDPDRTNINELKEAIRNAGYNPR
jgi:copper chaperone CopZ